MTKRICGVALGLWMLAVSASAQAQPTVGTLCQSTPGVWTPCEPGGGGSFNGLLLDAASGDPVTDTVNDALRVNVVAGSASGTTDADDASIAAGQTGLGLNASLTMAFDGTVWRRLTFGTAGTASAQVLTVQGITSMTPLLVTASATNLDVQIGGSDTVTVAPATGSFASDGTFGSTLPTTGPAVGFRADTTTPTAVTDGQQVAPYTDTLGRLQVLPGATDLAAGAVTGCALVSAASTNSTNCKASAGNFYGFRVINTTATLYYLRLYNTASAPTCSSATGFIESIPIPASTTGSGIVALTSMPEAYATGISYCFTGGSSSTDNTNAATGVFGRLFYK